MGDAFMEMALVSVANTSISKREQVNFTDFKKIEFQRILQEHGICCCVILSTCNRSEVYAFANREKLAQLLYIYASFFAIAKEEVCYLQGECAMQHLFFVSCGLKSSILGEDQIFNQVKQAYEFSCIYHMVNKQGHFIFQKLFRKVKEIKHIYRLSEHPRSTSHIAMKFLKRQIALEDSSYLLCGGGEIIKQCLPYIVKAKTIYVALRDLDKHKQVQAILPHVQIIPFAQRHLYFQKVDVIITATSAPHIIFKQEDYQADEKEHYVLDLALPRDVDARLYDEEHLHIYHIDDVQKEFVHHEEMKHAILEEVNQTVVKDAYQIYRAAIQNIISREVRKEEQAHHQILP